MLIPRRQVRIASSVKWLTYATKSVRRKLLNLGATARGVNVRPQRLHQAVPPCRSRAIKPECRRSVVNTAVSSAAAEPHSVTCLRARVAPV